jgi:hypothetical protein
VRSRFDPDPRRTRAYDRIYGVFADAVAAVLTLSERLRSPGESAQETGGPLAKNTENTLL